MHVSTPPPQIDIDEGIPIDEIARRAALDNIGHSNTSQQTHNGVLQPDTISTNTAGPTGFLSAGLVVQGQDWRLHTTSSTTSTATAALPEHGQQRP
eukprot:7626157-Karenia_brevis.AAC.1